MIVWAAVFSRVGAMLYLFCIGLVVDPAEARNIFRPSTPHWHGYLLTLFTVSTVWPATIFWLLWLLSDALSASSIVGIATMICVPGGPLSNVLALGIGGNVAFNAMLSLSMVVVSTFLMPAAAFVIPGLVGMQAEDIVSPLHELIANAVVTFIPFLLACWQGNSHPGASSASTRHLAPVGAFMYLIVVAGVVWNVPPLPLVSILLTIVFALAPCTLAAANVCLLRIDDSTLRRSMLIETVVHDVPLGSALAFVCFSRLPDPTLLQVAATMQIYGFSTVSPFAAYSLGRAMLYMCTAKKNSRRSSCDFVGYWCGFGCAGVNSVLVCTPALVP